MLTDNPAAPLILIVEDDDSHAEMIMRSFEVSREEYRLHSAKALHDARSVMAMHSPTSLVLTDYRLPDGDGCDLLKMVNDACPVIMMTSHGSEQVAVDAMKAGVLDYVVKSEEVFSTMPRIAQRALREWSLIEEHKQMELALALREQEFRAMIENAPDPIMRYDRECRRVYVNPALERISGIEAGSLLGKKPQEVKVLVPGENDKMIAWIRHVAETGMSAENELELVAHDGTVHYYHCRYVPECGKNGEVASVLLISSDITRRKAAEEEREKLQAQLLQSRKMESVGRLAGGVAHDFNNMLGIIIGYAEMAQTRVTPDQPIFADLLEIQQAAERSAALTQQLLAFARKQIVAPKVLDLNDTVSGMFKMLRRLIGEEIDLVLLPEEGLWPVKVDPSQIDQILVNLCVNARDAITDMGKITIETRTAILDDAYCTVQPEAVPGEYVLLAVSDNGSGMDKETLSKVFEPFFTTKELGKGTGLGLSTIYGIVKQNNGVIDVISEPGHGTSFKIYLPRFVTGAGQTEEKKKLAAPPAHGNETILLVEDEPSLMTMARLMLKSFGYRVLTAGAPDEAIRVANKYAGEIHLLLTDVVMPRMNGRDLADELASLYPGIRRMFMSGYTGDIIANHGTLEKGISFIQKPFSMPELAAKVREALDSKY